jgi:hypothetical protein
MQSGILRLLITGMVLFFSLNAQGQRWMGLRGEADTTEADKQGFVLLPLFYYTPDTRFAYGAAGVYYFKLKDPKTGEDSRLSYSQLLVDYTQNNQLDVWGLWNIFTPGERYLLKGELRFRNFPDRFYGFGNQTPAADMERYAYDLFSIKGLVMRNLGHHWFAGMDFHVNRDFNFKRDSDGILENQQPTGFDGGRSIALGAVAVHDGRDNVVNAYRGHYFEFSAYFYRPVWGSQFNFQNINLIHQTYRHLGGKRVLAWQGVYRGTSGDVPFLNMPVAGGLDILRGYPANRFRAKNMLAGQTEYRFGVWKRFGGVVFAGIGDVFDQPADFRWDALKYSVGGGIRFAMNPAERLNIRLDYGIGRGNTAFYLIVAEAF